MAAKVKKTKTALKAQRDALGRFQRYLPTLELKKQQLRAEVGRRESALEELDKRIENARAQIDRWVRLFADPQAGVELESLVTLQEARTETENIAGINIPVYQDARFSRAEIDLFATPPWLDDAIEAIERLAGMRIERRMLEEARDLLAEELRITSQRVNLFEKVKIPEAKENIRVIKIALGDAQTAAVARAKTAKNKRAELETAAT